MTPSPAARWAGPALGMALALAAVAGGAWWWTSQDKTAAAVPGAPERPPVVVVEDLPSLRDALDAQAERGRFSGAVLVAKGDRVLFRQAYGFADREAGSPVELTSRFRLASVSKQFTAAAILRLQDEGVLSVDDPLCRWIRPCPDRKSVV